MSLYLKFDGYRRLGLANILQVVWYVFRLKVGWLEKKLPIEASIKGVFFEALTAGKLHSLSEKYLDCELPSSPQLFGWRDMDMSSPPNWHCSVLSGKSLPISQVHWSQITDFNSGVGDIKGIWEPSRFSWALFFIQHYLKYQRPDSLSSLNHWIADWSQHNPANQGANWKCAQEVSLRVLHLAACSMLLEQKEPTPSLALFLSEHLQRIFPTLGYAKAQDNNHGTSEAAALYIGGSWLLAYDGDNVEAQKWQHYGHQYLNERVGRLVMPDGSFSQYSVTYHRLMLDTLCLVELWREFLSLPVFTPHYLHRVQKAAHWLHSVIDENHGDAPNIGANDGAHILNYAHVPYRDFRPTAELAQQLFKARSVFTDSGSRFICTLFGLNSAPIVEQTNALSFPEGGYGVLRKQNALCLLRTPAFKFRPSQADCLHLDLWVAGENILRDAGSYSYNTEQKWLNYFSGAEGHNTVQFDHRQSMPKVSRFLYAKWPRCKLFEVNDNSMRAEFTDWKKATHNRQVTLSENKVVIVDTLSGVFEEACLRWRLANFAWQLEGHSAIADKIQLSVDTSQTNSSISMAQGFESRYYGRKSTLPVLEVVVTKSTKITTTISWR